MLNEINNIAQTARIIPIQFINDNFSLKIINPAKAETVTIPTLLIGNKTEL